MYFDILARSYALWFAASLAVWGIVGAGIYAILNFIARKKKEKEITEILISELKKAEKQAVEELKAEIKPRKRVPRDEKLTAALEQELKAIYEAEMKAAKKEEDKIGTVPVIEIEEVTEDVTEDIIEDDLTVGQPETAGMENTASWQEVDDIYKKAFKI